MKNEYKVWRDRPYFIRSFPKLNKTIVWDDTEKAYQFYEGVVGVKKKEDIKPVVTTKKYYHLSIALAGVCGLLLASLIVLILNKYV